MKHNSDLMGKKIMRNLFDTPHANYVETGLSNQLAHQFIAQSDGDIFFRKITVALNKNKISLFDFLLKLKSYLDDARVTMPTSSGSAVIIGNHNDKPIMMWVNIHTYPEVNKFEISITSNAFAVNAILARISYDFEEERLPLIKWWFQGRHGEETKDFYLLHEHLQVLAEYYPDVDDPEKFIDDYINSDEVILLIAGPPGTGKTTLLRHMISKHKLCTHVIYDEKIMNKDAPFQQFLFSEQDYSPSIESEEEAQANMMIIEDADTILTSRERDGNKLMSRFLNVSDGLIKLPNKKLVFTTNIQDFGNVDPALLRAGRCFGVLYTRLLDFNEARAAAKVAGMPLPTENRQYALAEIFNQGKKTTHRSIGFGVRH